MISDQCSVIAKSPPSGTRTSRRAERSSRLAASRLTVSLALRKHATPTPSQRRKTLTPEPPYFEGRRGSAWTTLCQHLRQRALLRFSWLIFTGFQAQFSALKQNPNSIVCKKPEASCCRLDRLNPAVESLGDSIPAWRIRVELATETHPCRGRRLRPAFPACVKRCE